jgi:transposase
VDTSDTLLRGEEGEPMATKARWEFTAEFGREAVVLLQESGRLLARIVAELGIQPSMLRHWRAA